MINSINSDFGGPTPDGIQPPKRELNPLEQAIWSVVFTATTIQSFDEATSPFEDKKGKTKNGSPKSGKKEKRENGSSKSNNDEDFNVFFYKWNWLRNMGNNN